MQTHIVEQTKSDYPVGKACSFAFRFPPNGGISNFMICLQFLHALYRFFMFFVCLFVFFCERVYKIRNGKSKMCLLKRGN